MTDKKFIHHVFNIPINIRITADQLDRLNKLRYKKAMTASVIMRLGLEKILEEEGI